MRVQIDFPRRKVSIRVVRLRWFEEDGTRHVVFRARTKIGNASFDVGGRTAFRAITNLFQELRARRDEYRVEVESLGVEG